jgi:hypothetical protein
MTINPKRYAFEGIVYRTYTTVSYHYVEFPYSAIEEFGMRGPVRVICQLNGQEYFRALIPSGNGQHHLILSQAMRKQTGAALGSMIPEELEAAFELEPAAERKFNTLGLGAKRGMCHWIDSAKRPETRAKRAAEMLGRLLADSVMLGGKKVG